MPIEISGGGSGGGGSGTVTAVSSTTTAISVANPNTTPALTVATLDVIAADGPPAANWSNNSHKITSIANGSAAQDAAAFGQIPTALPPNGSAGGDLGSTYPNPTVTSGAHLGAATVPIASLADPTTGKVIGSSSNAAAAVFPPGYEIGYDQVTTNVTVSSTTEASGTLVVQGSAYTFDGAPVMAEFFCGSAATGASNALVIFMLWEGSTEICRWADYRAGYQGVAFARLRFTPTAASHTYKVTAIQSGGNATLTAGSGTGGAGTYPPIYLRFTKV